jgi:acetylornithine deacetylase/succinyl-diaminopimelate desuccinylase-like protein
MQMNDTSEEQTSINAVLARLDETEQQALVRLFAWLRIPSISADPAYDDACQQAAEWSAEQLKELGFTTTIHPTPGQPMVVGHWRHPDPSARHVLFYGHYDVQPVDPLELWNKPPFEPHIAKSPINGPVIVARGANDDKGQVMTFLEACRAWRDETGGLPVSITVFLEGEEESGSHSLPAFLQSHGDELKAEYALVCDTTQWDRTTPAVTTSLRGIAHIELTVTGPNRDLHSGMFGGPAMNPIRALTHVLGGLFDESGRIQIPGFYDGIVDPTAEQLAQWQALNFDITEFLGEVGLSRPMGEADRGPLEQLWSRPTAEINGIWGGYSGEGNKTIIPSVASAKLTFRLVPGQDPTRVLDGFKAFVAERLPVDTRVSFKNVGGTAALSSDTTHPIMRQIASALHAEWNVAPVFMGCGASIPIVEAFKRELGMDTALVGFGLNDDNIHSPNEKYNVESFTKGARSWARILGKLGE